MAWVQRIEVSIYLTPPQAIVDTSGIPLLQTGLDLSLSTPKVSSVVAQNSNRRTSSSSESCESLNK